MGEVWRGVHAATGIPVAVKLLTHAFARDEQFRASFRNEARAAASLDHPYVVAVVDFGLVPESAPPPLIGGSPYLAMEWASGGTLSRAPAPRSWRELRALLLQILGALGHAHARGIIHCDLKPGNVLLTTASDARAGVKLADFGLARLVEESSRENALIGTAQYMAPEQVLGQSRDQGPWTDLYALGCVAYRLASGKLPFRGTPSEIVAAHVQQVAPLLEAELAIPEEFPRWVATLLEKDPRRRYRCAADAAWALERISDIEISGSAPIPSAPASDPNAVTMIVEHVSTTARSREISTRGALVAGAPTESPFVGHEAPPMPASWRRDGPEAPAPRLLDTGLGLFGLREVPLVGREVERDALWDVLARVHEGEARLVILEGPSGSGKSRLARWLVERALETGAAAAFRVRGDAENGGGDLARMLASALRCEELKFDDALPRVSAALAAQGIEDAEEARALTALVAPKSAPVAIGSTNERYAIVQRFLERAAVERPVVVWIDDAHANEDALAFSRRVLETTEGARVLFVATARTDTESAPLLEQLRARADVTTLEVGPLPPEQRGALVRELLGLDGELAVAVEERTAGSPLFAVQLVGDWVQRGILEPAARGFHLRPGAHAALPADLAVVWRERVEALAQERPEGESDGLEIAAALGHAVEPALWEAACADVGLGTPWSLVDAMLDGGLATCDERGPREGWSFAHGMLREALLERARTGGRLAPHHACCAAALSARPEAHPARLGRHLHAAGDPAAAIAPLLAAARASCDAGESALTQLLVRECADAMRAARVPESDVRWGEVWIYGARQTEGTDATLASCEKIIDAARRYAWAKIHADALVAKARAFIKLARPEEAGAICDEARAIYDSIGVSAWPAVHWQGVAAIERGDIESGRAFHEHALAIAEPLGDEPSLADSHYEVGLSLRPSPAGRPHLEKALAIDRKLGRGLGTANALLGLGELERDAGDFASAESYYREALKAYERLGSPNAPIARLNMGLALLAQSRWEEALRMLSAGRAQLERMGWRSMLACAHVEMAAACAGLEDWRERDGHFAKARAAIGTGKVADPDLGWAASLAGNLAAHAGDAARAREAWELARTQWTALGRARELENVEAKLASLPTHLVP